MHLPPELHSMWDLMRCSKQAMVQLPSLLGMPDFGFLNAGETVDNARRIIRAVDRPVIVDVDTGYGNPLSVWRLVRDLESMGAEPVYF